MLAVTFPSFHGNKICWVKDIYRQFKPHVSQSHFSPTCIIPVKTQLVFLVFFSLSGITIQQALKRFSSTRAQDRNSSA